MDPIRIGIIGAGDNTRKKHLPGLQALPGVEVVCVANRTEASGRWVADEFNIPRVHEHWTEVIDDPDVDAICIGTWPYLHCDATIAALEARKHVLCEARMAMNAAEARDMLAVWQRSGLVAMLVPSPFGLKGDQVMAELIGGGYLGELRELYVRGLTDALADPTAPLHWRQRSEFSGLNVLLLGILYETAQRWFGQAESVLAQTSLFVSRRIDADTGLMQDADVPDSVAVLARMAGGASCVYHLSGHSRHAGAMRIEAYGSAGTLVYDLAADTIHGARSGDSALAPIEIPPEKAGGWQVEADFIAAIRDAKLVTRTSFVDGVKYMTFTEAVRRSADEGRRVYLSEFS
jgi:predicted dehydrogenase